MLGVILRLRHTFLADEAADDELDLPEDGLRPAELSVVFRAVHHRLAHGVGLALLGDAQARA